MKRSIIIPTLTVLALSAIPPVYKNAKKKHSIRKYQDIAKNWQRKYGNLADNSGIAEYDHTSGVWHFWHPSIPGIISSNLPSDLTTSHIGWLENGKEEIAIMADTPTPWKVSEEAEFAAQFEVKKSELNTSKQSTILILGIWYFSSKNLAPLYKELIRNTLIAYLK